MKKLCARCRLTKPLADFNRNRSTTSGYRAECRLCSRSAAKAFRERNKIRHFLAEHSVPEWVGADILTQLQGVKK